MSKSKIAVIACVCAIAGVAASIAQAAPGDTLGISTLVQRILPESGPNDFKTLTTGPGEPYVVRTGSDGANIGEAKDGRAARRTSLGYFGQLTDFQLADEESPARVEFLDPLGAAFTSSWRPGEALNPQEANAMIAQMNAFAANAPELSGDGSKPPMDFVVNTGDISDSQQYNETLWNQQLIDGETVTPGSGVDPATELGTNPLCPNSLAGDILDAADPELYTGVQDRDDWPNAEEWYFYDPDEPNPLPEDPTKVNPYIDAPEYPGLMDRAQESFEPVGLDVPGYMVFGNHDNLVQGNAWASELFNYFAQGCLKPVADKAPENATFDPLGFLDIVTDPDLTVEGFLDIYEANPDQFMAVPPDPQRRLISKKEYKDIWKSSGQDDGHGFGFIDPAEESASNGYAGYYSFSPRPGVRYVTLDTTSEGGVILTSSEGNLDTPQFDWFENQLKAATAAKEIVIVFSHHAVESLGANVPDENAPSCGTVDPAEVVGCDGDPRTSTPIKLKDDLIALMHKYPAAVAWVAGHSHENSVEPFKDPAGKGGFWSIRTAALADWPKQNRLLQIFDNKDGTLSIFGTLIDQAAPVPAPAPGTAASTMTNNELASLSRTIGYNDNQTGGDHCEPVCDGTAADRNVELLVNDPRVTADPPPPPPPPPAKANISRVKVTPKTKSVKAGKKTKLTVQVTNSGDAAATNVKVRLKSSNKRVRVKRTVTIKRIAAGKTAKVKITVRAKLKAKGKAKVTATVGKRKGAATVKVKRAKRRR